MLHYSAGLHKLIYHYLSGGVRLKLLVWMIHTDFISYFPEEAYLSEDEIIQHFHMDAHRGKKWLHLLCIGGFLNKKKHENNAHITYALSHISREIKKGDVMKHLARRIQKWDELEKTSLEDVLKGAPVENPMKWPPQMDAEGLQLEETNTITHHYPLRVLLNHYNFRDTRKLLDVGGGEATISCGLAKKYPHLHCTVYNLINTQKSAETNIKQNRLEKQVDFVVGDFVKDTSFPKGYDVILFSRVLWNWSSEMNLKQLQMAYDALEPGGTVLIVEAFSETNLNFALYMQYRQFFWDDFPPGAFKYSSEYKEMLKIIGFKNILYSSSPTSIFSLMTAEKPKKDHL